MNDSSHYLMTLHHSSPRSNQIRNTMLDAHSHVIVLLLTTIAGNFGNVTFTLSTTFLEIDKVSRYMPGLRTSNIDASLYNGNMT